MITLSSIHCINHIVTAAQYFLCYHGDVYIIKYLGEGRVISLLELGSKSVKIRRKAADYVNSLEIGLALSALSVAFPDMITKFSSTKHPFTIDYW